MRNYLMHDRLIGGLTILLVMSLLQGCGSTSPSHEDDDNHGAIVLSLSRSSATLPQGGTVAIQATLTREGGFGGAVSFSASGAPSGVVASIAAASTTGTTTTATAVIVAAADAPSGVYPLTITASGQGVTSATATFTLTIESVTSPNYSLALSPASASVIQGESTNTTVTLLRTGGFDKEVQLSLTNAPAGVTASFTPMKVAGSTSAAVIRVASSTAPGTYTVYVGGVASGVGDKVTPFVLTVAAVGSYTLSVPATLTIAQGSSVDASVGIARNGGFNGTVALAATNLPTGMTAGFTPQSTTGTSSSLHLTASASVAPGNYQIGVQGSSGTNLQTATISVTVIPTGGGTGNVRLSVASCPANQKPVWVAGQNGVAAWQVLTPVNQVYSFQVTAGKGGYAYVQPDDAGHHTVVLYFSQAELTSNLIDVCGSEVVSGKTLQLPVTGLAPGETATFAMGGASASTTVDATVTLNQVPAGMLDLLGWRSSFDFANPLISPLNRGFVRRDVNATSGSTLSPASFGSAESFAPLTATVTATNATGTLMRTELISTGPACAVAAVPASAFSTTIYGIPASHARSDDYYTVTATDNATESSRTIVESFKIFGNRTITFGPSLSTVTTVLAGPYKRLQSSFTLPTEYRTSATMQYYRSGTDMRMVMVSASYAWLGGASAVLAMPDFSALSNWNNSWVPEASASVSWITTVFGGDATPYCTDGARMSFATRSGSN